MKQGRRALRRAFAVCIALLAVHSGGTARAADLVRVGTPEASAFMFAILNAGMEAGIFAKHGVTVQRIDFAGGGKLQQGMTAGAVDISLTGNSEMAFIAKGAAEKAVAVTAGPPVDMVIMVRDDGSITKPADLKGKTIGVTTPTSLTAWLALAFAQKEGWGPDGVKRASIGDMSSLVAALRTKAVDAIVGPIEGGYILESKGAGKPLVTFGDIDLFITHVFYASDSMMKNHPDVLRRFLSGWFDTVQFVRTHKAETLRIVEPVTHLTPDIASKIYDLETPALSTDGKFDPKAVAAIMQSFVTLGLMTQVPANDKGLYTEAFLP